MAGCDFLFLRSITVHLGKKSVTYGFMPLAWSSRPSESQPVGGQAISYGLVPLGSGGPALACEVEYSDDGRQASIVLSGKTALPAITLDCALPPNVVPVRCNEPKGEYANQAALGAAVRLRFDGLTDVRSGAMLTFADVPALHADSSGYHVRARLEASSQRRSTVLRLELLHGSLQVLQRVERAPLSPSESAPPATLEQARERATAWALRDSFVPPPFPGFEQRSAARQPELKDFVRLPVDRLELVERTLPVKGVRSVDHFLARETGVRNLAIGLPPRQWNVLAISGKSDRNVTRALSLKVLGIARKGDKRFAVYDFWQQQLVAITDDVFEIDVPPAAWRVAGVQAIPPDEPAVVSTNGDITQGFYDLGEVRYDARAMTLTGTSRVRADEPHELRILLPAGRQSVEVVGVEADAAGCFLRADGPLRMVALENPIERTVAWRVRFRKGPQVFGAPAPPMRLATQQNTRGVLLSWDSGEPRPLRYRLYRDGQRLETVAGSVNQFQDSTAVYDTEYRYTIRSVDWAGKESEASLSVGHRTPLPANTYLTQLVPLSVVQGSPPMTTNKGATGKALRIAGRRYSRGLGIGPGARVEYFLGKGYESFSGEVGVDDETRSQGEVRFEIYGDGRLLFKSAPLRVGQKPQRFQVSVRGKQMLALAVSGGGGPGESVYADWGDTYLRAAARGDR